VENLHGVDSAGNRRGICRSSDFAALQQKGLARAENARILAPCCTATIAELEGPGSAQILSQPLENDMLTAEQVLASQKATIDTLFGLTGKAFEGMEKVLELNVTASKAALAEAAGTTHAFFSVKDPQEVLALQAAMFQPLAEKTAAYSRHLYDIASGTGAEFGRTFEEQASEAQRKFLSVVDSAAKNAPAGSETAVAVLKSAIAASTNAFETVQKSFKQAAEVAEANFNAVANQAVNVAKTSTSKKRGS
jgi:phasin family protein